MLERYICGVSFRTDVQQNCDKLLQLKFENERNQMAADKDGGWQGSMGFAQFAAGGEEDSSEEEETPKEQELIGRGMGCAHFAGGTVRGSNKLEVF